MRKTAMAIAILALLLAPAACDMFSEGEAFEYIFRTPIYENMARDKIKQFWNIMEQEWADVLKVKPPIFSSID